MGFAEELDRLRDAGTTRDQVRTPAPAGWEPGVKYQPDGSRLVTLPPSEELAEESDWTQAVARMGLTVPDGYRVRLVEAKYDPAAWHRDQPYQEQMRNGQQVKAPAVTRPIWRYRFAVEPAPERIDINELLAAIPRKRKPAASSSATASYVWLVGDTQWGKVDGGGSAGTLERWYDSLDRAVARCKHLRKRSQAGPVVILVAGDCIEGTEASNPLTRVDLTVTEMVRVYRRTLADAVTAFAELADDVHVAVVPGNHDDAKRLGKGPAYRYDDSWAIEGASQVADVMAAKGYNVAWTFPDPDRMHLTIDASGTRIGLLHGHQTRGKMESWLASKALSRDPIGTADVVASGHYHHLRLEQYASTTWMQTSSLDGGSIWWENIGGLSAPPASLTFLAEGGKWNSLEVV